MAFDRFETRIDPSGHLVELHINGTPLIELVREVELPFATREYDERVAAGETDVGPRGWLAGQYNYRSRENVLDPSRTLLGEPSPLGFVLATDDRRLAMSLVLECTCGIPECWMLLAQITLTAATVTWSDFCQFHRDWTYELGPFCFERSSYEAALTSTSARRS